MYLSVVTQFDGALYPLTALITFCQVCTGTVLAFITDKSKTENRKDGIIYETAMIENQASMSDCITEEEGWDIIDPDPTELEV